MLQMYNVTDYKMSKKNILCFGASKGGKRFLNEFTINYMNYHIKMFTDNNQSTWGKKLYGPLWGPFKDGVPVNNLDIFCDYCKIYKDAIIVITSVFYEQIYNQLKTLGIENDILYFEEFEHLVRREFKLNVLLPEGDKFADKYYYYNDIFVNDGRLFYGRKIFQMYLLQKKNIPTALLIAPPKVGNLTLSNSLTACGGMCSNSHSGVWFENLHKDYPDLLPNKIKNYIIGIREPVAQNLSLLFQINNKLPMLPADYNIMDAQEMFDRVIYEFAMGKSNENSIINQKMLQYRGVSLFRYLIQNFFDNEYEQTVGINVFNYEFDKKRGYITIEKEGRRYFIYRLENLKNLEIPLRDFFRLDKFKIINSNIGNEKYYQSIYKQFLAMVNLPNDYLEYVYSSKFFKHFYTEKEKESFLQHWKKR